MQFTAKPIDTAALVARYEAGESLERIAQDVNLTSGGIRHRLLKAGVTMRPKNQGVTPSNKKPVSTETLYARYAEGAPAHVVGREFGLSAKAVLDRFTRKGLQRRQRSDYEGKKGAENPNWKGGRFMREDGYVLMSGRGRNVFEHRVVMERVIGRKLTSKEHVHHVNGIRHDNRPENLVITHPSKHESRTLIKALQRRICYLESLLQEAHSEKFLLAVSGTRPT